MYKKFFLLSFLLTAVILYGQLFFCFGEPITNEENLATDSSTPEGDNPVSQEESTTVKDDTSTISESLNEEQAKQFSETSESFSFQTEVNRLMDIIINSLYMQKDVFLREMISNAADALEKARFLSISNPEYLKDVPELEVRVELDPVMKTITIQDTGVGMTKDELIQNLGTVARSGTTNFLEAVTESGDLNLIGQFGVGFYSAFLVADKVTVASKSYNDTDQHIWESRIGGTFTVGKDPRGDTLGRGTKITLHLKDDSTDYLSEEAVESVILRFNQFINFPIKIRKPVKEGKEKQTKDHPESEEKPEESSSEDDEKPLEEKTKSDEEPQQPPPLTYKWEVVNIEKPLWMRPKESITDQEYKNFYVNFARDAEPAAYTHFSAEGDIEFKALLFVPNHPPVDSYSSYVAAKQEAIRLYSRRVLIADSVYDLLPKWLGFIRGIVDSDDLPLKVDRESFSQLKVVSVIRKKIITKFLELIQKLSKQDLEEWAAYHEELEKLKKDDDKKKKEDDDKKKKIEPPKTTFGRIWNVFGRNIKIGCVEDTKNRKRIIKLSRFLSSKLGPDEPTTLDGYISRMSESQKDIYYITAEKFDGALNAPHMQYFNKKNYEVFILLEPLDEPCLERTKEYEGKRLLSIEKANVQLESDVDKLHEKRIKKAFEPLTKAWAKQFKSQLRSVRLTFRLVDDPAVITVDEHGASAYGDRIARTQLFGTGQQAKFGWMSRYLEINPSHPLIKKMLNIAKTNPEDSELKETGTVILDTALLANGFVVNDPTVVSRKLYRLLQSNFGIPEDESTAEYQLTEEELAYNPEGNQPSSAAAETDSKELPMDEDESSANEDTSALHDQTEKNKKDKNSEQDSSEAHETSKKKKVDYQDEIDRIDAEIQDQIYKKGLGDFKAKTVKEEKEMEDSLAHDEL